MANVADILKQTPAGTKLWSNIFGKVELIGVNVDNFIKVRVTSDVYYFFSNGQYFNMPEGECTLWPSKDHRAWDDEAYKILGIEKKPPFGLQPFDRVLVRDSFNEKWSAEFFSHIDDNLCLPYICVGCQWIGCQWKYCIPYNDETKHLLGTTQMPPEKYRQ